MTSRFLDSCQLNISTLGKIHIGTGHDLDPTHYVIEGSRLYEFSTDALMAVLTKEDRQELLNLVSKPGSAAMVRQVHRFIQFHGNRLKSHAYPPMQVSAGMARLYRDRMDSKSEHHNALEIQRTYRNPATGHPILPGSSLKGAIRTALLNQRQQGKTLPRDQRAGRDAARNLEQSLFRYREFHQDPMRLVQVGDAEIMDAQNPPRTSVVFAVNRKKKAVQHRGQEVRSRADNLYQMLEVVGDRQAQQFQSSLVLHRIDENPAHQGAVPEPQFHFTAPQIALACNEFYLPLLEKELELLQQRGFSDAKWHKSAINFHKAAAAHRERFFLLRIGHHSGAEAVTIEGARDIKIMQGRGQQSRFGTSSETLWLAASEINDHTHLIPFGWLGVGLN